MCEGVDFRTDLWDFLHPELACLFTPGWSNPIDDVSRNPGLRNENDDAYVWDQDIFKLFNGVEKTDSLLIKHKIVKWIPI